MSANYWDSSQRNHWTVTRQGLLCSRLDDLQFVDYMAVARFHIYFANFIHSIGKKLRLRQEIHATACVFFKRFYLKNSFSQTDPFLTATTSLYLACKVEELPHHLKTIFNESRNILQFISSIRVIYIPTYAHPTLDNTSFTLLNPSTAADFFLSVMYFLKPRFLNDLPLDRGHLQFVWYVINDSLRTDVCLLYPPHMIALGSLYIATVHRQPGDNQTMKTWFAKLNVDIVEILNVAQDMITMYEVWHGLDENEVLKSLETLQTRARQVQG
ncbi:cyclin-like protein [Dimargaris cristalligena]|uniref:Cyclin-like protein n=1 Tax=Dimargaris cristalligena TaxID=215637 RepID=A0A4P9ZT10_9FUNG|nr:cyclin-like protein [Dimargaris cristalligena]|eukprot:RKP36633.1 cyclin-like protein [Dimargaris cristalligena]